VTQAVRPEKSIWMDMMGYGRALGSGRLTPAVPVQFDEDQNSEI
jgi:hypothetical protein